VLNQSINQSIPSLFSKQQRNVRLPPVFHHRNKLASSVACTLGVAATFIHLMMMTSKACDSDTSDYTSDCFVLSDAKENNE